MEKLDKIPESNNSARWGHLNFVDALRGLAILLVILRHWDTRIPFVTTTWAPWIPERIQEFLFNSGAQGVRIFFVISGFLITRTALQKWGELGKIKIASFYRIRFARIGPCLLLLLGLLSLFHFLGVSSFVIKPEISTLPRALFSALTFHLNWLSAELPVNLPGSWTILWTLSVEEMFYFFFPLVCVIFRKEKYLLPILFLFVVLGPLARTVLTDNHEWKTKSYLSCMDNIAMGCLAALISWRYRFSKKTLHLFLAIGAFLCVLTLLFREETRQTGLARYGFNSTLLGLGMALVLIARAPFASTESAERFQILRRFGVNSYEIYLFHIPLLNQGYRLFRFLGFSTDWSPLWSILMLALCLAFGEALRRFYSDPLRRKIRGLS